MTYRPRSGSIQIDVPVKPVWPNARGETKEPAEESSEGVSHPSARLDPAGRSTRRVKSATVFAETIRRPAYTPPSSIIWAKRARSPAVANSPACGAMPPIAYAFSSCTTPRRTPPRQGSSSVGAMRARCASSGQYTVSAMPRGANTRRATKASSGSPAVRSSTAPSRITPRSL
jgi:hypothetical protein